MLNRFVTPEFNQYDIFRQKCSLLFIFPLFVCILPLIHGKSKQANVKLRNHVRSSDERSAERPGINLPYIRMVEAEESQFCALAQSAKTICIFVIVSFFSVKPNEFISKAIARLRICPVYHEIGSDNDKLACQKLRK